MGSWQKTVNVAGVTPSEGFIKVDTGPYKAIIVDTALHTKDDKESIKFSLSIAEGKFKGVAQYIYVGLDASKDGNRRRLRAALESVGAKPEALEKGDIGIKASTFEGKACYIFVQQPPAGEKQPDGRDPLPEIYFLTAKTYQERLAGAAAAVTTPTTAQAGHADAGVSGLAGALGGQTAQPAVADLDL